MRNALGALVGHSKFNSLATVAVAVMLGACSTSIERFAANPSDADPVYTASVKQPKRISNTVADNTDDEGISSKPLGGSSWKPTYSYKAPAPAYKAPAYKAAAKAPTYQAPSYNEPDYNSADASAEAPTYLKPKVKKPTYSKLSYDQPEADAPAQDTQAYAPPLKRKNPARIVNEQQSAAADEATSGATVTVQPGNTLYSIARANNVSVTQLARANNIQAPFAVKLGQRLTIPGHAEAVSPQVADAAPAEEAPVARPVHVKAGGSHTVASGETLYSLGRKYGVSPFAIADLNGLSHDKPLSLGQSIRIPAGGRPVVASAEPVAPKMKAPAPATEEIASDDSSVEATPDLPKTKAPAKIAAAQDIPQAEPPAVEPAQQQQAPLSGGAPGMRWPVKGRIISEFGPKSNGMKNEGINIAVPEGTGVRAADSGVVAYAGNELKGYGNLVLIRHQGGWVTAYAHNKELFVKRGDTVNRGDVIAKAGQTGSVTSPQLHFEVRKGATAMDPIKFLNATTASN